MFRESTLSALALFAPIATAAAQGSRPKPPEPASYRGLRHVPEGVETVLGWLVGSHDGVQYSLQRARADTLDMIWLSANVGRAPGSSQPIWEVRAVLVLPPLAPDEQFAPEECTVAGHLDPDVFTIAKRERSHTLRSIRRAWRANLERQVFEVIAVDNVFCANPGFEPP